MCKRTKNLPIQYRGAVGFSGLREEDLTRGGGNSGGVETPVGALL